MDEAACRRAMAIRPTIVSAGMGATAPLVSFVVIAHNEAAGIAATLRSIAAQNGDHEVIVVDDGSTDGTATAVLELAEADGRIRLHRLHENRGRGFARRTGVGLARGELLATVDADIVLPGDWLTRCREAIEHTPADAAAGTALPDGDVAYIAVRLRLRPRPRAHTTAVTGSNTLFRHAVLEGDSFDPALREGEDVALGHTLAARGARLVTVDGLYVEHREGKGLLQTLAWLHQSGRGATRQLHRYRELRGPDLATAGWLLTLGLAAAGRPRHVARWAPAMFTAAVAAGHVTPAFAWDSGAQWRWPAAVALDATLLTAYFTGRIAGALQLARGAGR